MSFFLGTTALFSQANQNPTLLEIGEKKISLEEFEAVFNKNPSEKTSKPTKKEVDDYLDLFVKFKLKVFEAEQLGLDTLTDFKQELSGYRKQLAQPYLSDKEVTEKLIEEAYERTKTDIKAAHILIRITLDAEPKDTLIAYNKLMKIRKRILAGEDFEKIAAETSEDPSAKTNKGNLGYFSAFQMVYPFEDAAFNTEIGKVSMPVRTSFGYHLIKTLDKRPARGTLKAAHIMIRADRKGDAAEFELRKQKIDEIYAKVTADNADFAALAKQFSEDTESAKKGGELPAFGTGKMVEEFEEAAFTLKNDGDISKPTLTDYGWHIIKRLELKGIDSFEEMYPSLKAKVARDMRSNKSKEIVITTIKNNNNFKENIKTRNDFFTAINVEKFSNGNWNPEDVKQLNKVMFSFTASDGDKMEYTQQDFANRIAKHAPKEKQSVDIKNFITNLYDKVVEESAINFKDKRLPIISKEFRLLMQEYREGILLFNLTDQMVWTKAIKDSVGLAEFYEKNKTNFMWDERADATLYKCSNEKVATSVQKLLKAKAKKGYTQADILKLINKTSQLDLTIEEGKFTKNENETVAKATWQKGAISKINNTNEVVLVEINDVLPAQPKKLDEVRGAVTSEYQNYLEKNWLDELKNKYAVKVHQEVVERLYK